MKEERRKAERKEKEKRRKGGKGRGEGKRGEGGWRWKEGEGKGREGSSASLPNVQGQRRIGEVGKSDVRAQSQRQALLRTKTVGMHFRVSSFGCGLKGVL